MDGVGMLVKLADWRSARALRARRCQCVSARSDEASVEAFKSGSPARRHQSPDEAKRRGG